MKRCTRDETRLLLFVRHDTDFYQQLKQRELTNRILIGMLVNTSMEFTARVVMERQRVTFAHLIMATDKPTTAIQ